MTEFTKGKIFLLFLVIVNLLLENYFAATQQHDGIMDIEPQAWQSASTTQFPLDDEQSTNVTPSDTALMGGNDQWPDMEQGRRRRRRRKKRPNFQQHQNDGDRWQQQNDENNDNENLDDTTLRSSRNLETVQNDRHGHQRRPHQKNERIREPFEELENREQQRKEQSQLPEQSPDNKSYRRPYSMAKKEEEIQANNKAADLRNILKQAGGTLSLSEILQQRNLSLSDLLNKKQAALEVLTQPSSSENPSLTEANEEISKPALRRLPGIVKKLPVLVDLPQPTVMTLLSSRLPKNNNNDDRKKNPNYSSSLTPPELSAETMITGEDDGIENKRMPTSFILPPNPTLKIEQRQDAIMIQPETADVPTIASAPAAPKFNRLSNRDERYRPIKEVISGIRPDFGNSNTKTVKRPPIALTPSLEPQIELTNTTVRPQRWRPSNEGRERIPLKFNMSKTLEQKTTTTQQPEIVTEEVVTENNQITEIPTTTITTRITKAAAPKIISTTNRPLGAIRDFRNRLSLRPKIRLPSSPKSKEIILKTQDSTETENYPSLPIVPSSKKPEIITENKSIDETGIKPQLEYVNVIGKFTSFADTKPKDVETIEELFGASLNHGDFPQSNTARSDSIFEADIIERVIQNTQRALVEAGQARGSLKMDVTESNPSLFADIISEKSVDDKTDLLELMGDRRSGARLSKVLAQRNMTLEELIEHRQRGSSQLHLKEFYNNRTAKPFREQQQQQPPPPPPPPILTGDNFDIVTAFENFPHFNLPNVKSVKPDEIKTDSQGSSYFASVINVRPTDDAQKESRAMREQLFTVKSAMEPTQSRNNNHYPQWKTSGYPTNYNPYDNNYIGDSNTDSRSMVLSSSRVSLPDTSNYLDDIDLIEKQILRANDLLDLDLPEQTYKRSSVTIENTQMTVGVRSAIIASSCIVALSVGIFIMIFVACRWRQRRQRKLQYSESFNGTRGRLPILHRETSKRSTSPVVYQTTGHRSSKLNTMDPNSPQVQDYLYDAMRKPFQ